MICFDDPVSKILVKQMDACTLRQRVIANNVANVNTPGFKKSTVNFQKQLQAVLGSGNSIKMNASSPRHLPGDRGLESLAAEVVQVKNTSMKAGKNNVDIDQEMVDLAANTLLYRLVTRVKSERGNIMSMVIKGG